MRKLMYPIVLVTFGLGLSACGGTQAPAVSQPDTHLKTACEEVSGAIMRLQSMKDLLPDLAAGGMLATAISESGASSDPRGPQLADALKPIRAMTLDLPQIIDAHGRYCS